MKKKKKLNKINGFDIFLIVFLAILALLILYPFYNAILISIISEKEYITTPILLFPKDVTFDAYKYLFKEGSLFNGMIVTLFVTIVGIMYNMFLTVLCSYILTKAFPGRKILSYAIVFTMYFGGGLIPEYLLIKNIGLMDSVFSMILPTGITFMYMVVIRRHFENIPKSLEESARIDGASDIVILFKVILPLSLPILATFALYYGVDRWNEWWNGMLYIRSVEKQPLQLVLRNMIQNASDFTGESTGIEMKSFSEGMKMASTVITMLPIMFLYPFLQKYFIAGLTVGAVKE